MKSTDLIGHIKFLPWQQLEGCNMTRPFLSAKGVACETNEYKQEFYIVSQPRLTSFLKKEKGWINCAYKLCSTTSHSAVMVLVSLVPIYFSYLVENWVWSTAYSIFVQMGQNAGPLFFSNECLTALKIAFHIV